MIMYIGICMADSRKIVPVNLYIVKREKHCFWRNLVFDDFCESFKKIDSCHFWQLSPALARRQKIPENETPWPAWLIAKIPFVTIPNFTLVCGKSRCRFYCDSKSIVSDEFRARPLLPTGVDFRLVKNRVCLGCHSGSTCRFWEVLRGYFLYFSGMFFR